MQKFDRADYFYYFMGVGTTIEFTAKIDVTKMIERCTKDDLNFQAIMLYQLYKAINTIENFKYDVLEGNLIEWDKIVPTFSSMNKNSKLFFTLYADMQETCAEYNEQYRKTVEEYANSTTIVPQGTLPENIFNVSCIPWLHFEHFSSNSKSMENNVVKMLTFGKYEKIDGCFVLPLTIQISHANADGYHVALFFKKLQEELNLM
ncbi:CatA-like O-acetyltransferase [Enterocloster lavalensis]|uniref:CatA-like O-acetyltransferase n=1 Tax=Enterocloster lavalensis TaxID=460384 RepID=UPI001D072BD4|nr:CatA-like O-acetyltransferase [Enterocloster lavalensis]MCB6345461.1 hypothetical protein [Enterocloster lavalensis]